MGDRYQGRSQKQTDVGSDLWWNICCQLHCKYLYIYVDADVFIKRWFLRMSHLHISVVTWLMNELKWCTCILTDFMETICRAWSRHICYRIDMKDLSDGRTYFHSMMCEFFFYCKNDSISYTYIVCHLVRCLSACLSLLMQFNCVLIFTLTFPWPYLQYSSVFWKNYL